MSKLGLQAVYGEDSLVVTGPLVVGAGAGGDGAFRVLFDAATSPLEVRNKSGFELSANGRDYYSADIVAHTPGSVTLATPGGGPGPAAAVVASLRYILHDTPCINQTCAIYGADSGLPSPPLVANLVGHAGADPVGFNLTAAAAAAVAGEGGG